MCVSYQDQFSTLQQPAGVQYIDLGSIEIRREFQTFGTAMPRDFGCPGQSRAIQHFNKALTHQFLQKIAKSTLGLVGRKNEHVN